MVVTEIESVTALMSASVVAGLVHTWLGPDHYLPLVGFSKLERWSLRRSLCVTAVVGLAHCALALLVVLGVGFFAGMIDVQLAGASSLSWLWVGLGLALLVTGLRRRRRGGEANDRRAPAGVGVVRWLWLVGFVLGPCEWLWPFALPALRDHGLSGALLVTVGFTAATIVAMGAAVVVGLAATARWRPSPGGAQAALGALLAASGTFVLLGF